MLHLALKQLGPSEHWVGNSGRGECKGESKGAGGLSKLRSRI